MSSNKEDKDDIDVEDISVGDDDAQDDGDGNGDHNNDEAHHQGLHANKHRSSASPTALRCSTRQSGL